MITYNPQTQQFENITAVAWVERALSEQAALTTTEAVQASQFSPRTIKRAFARLAERYPCIPGGGRGVPTTLLAEDVQHGR
jgi:hypothetical protein